MTGLKKLCVGLPLYFAKAKMSAEVPDYLEPEEIPQWEYWKKHFDGHWCLSLFFNDMLAWGSSMEIVLPTTCDNRRAAYLLIKGFIARSDVQDILHKFNSVPYPKRTENGYDGLEHYFNENVKIHNEFAEKLSEYHNVFKLFPQELW